MANQKPKVKSPSKTRLAAILRESVFDPRKDGPLKIVAEHSSITYLEFRAIEMIQQAQSDADDDRLTSEQRVKECDFKLAQAISLLALVRARRLEKI